MRVKLIEDQPIDGQVCGAGSELDLAPDLAQSLLVRGKAEFLEKAPRKAVVEAAETPEKPAPRRKPKG